MSEGLICPTCTIKLGDMGELAAHVKECGSLASGAKQSALVKSQQRVWQDACTQLHQGLISYDNYARVLGPKMYTRRHWVCQDMSGGKKVSKVSVRAEPSDSSAKFRVLKEGEILFEIDNAYKERRVWIKFFDIERNCLAWFATTSRSGRTVRASEIRHPKPEGYVHPASQGNTPMLKSKRIVQEAAPASAPAPVPAPQLVVPPGELYKPGLDSESDEGDAMVDIRAQAMARLRRQRNASSVNVAVTGDIAVRSAEEVDGADCTSDDDHTTDGERRGSVSGPASGPQTPKQIRPRALSDKQMAALPLSERLALRRGSHSSFDESSSAPHSVHSPNAETTAAPDSDKQVADRGLPEQNEAVSELRAEVEKLNAELDKERRDSVMAAEAARSKLLALKTELSTTSAQLKHELQMAKAQFDAELQDSNKKLEKALSAAERAETDLAAASVKATKLERYAVQKSAEAQALEKKLEFVKAEYSKMKQAQVLLVREVRKLRAEVTNYKGKLVLAGSAAAAAKAEAAAAVAAGTDNQRPGASPSNDDVLESVDAGTPDASDTADSIPSSPLATQARKLPVKGLSPQASPRPSAKSFSVTDLELDTDSDESGDGEDSSKPFETKGKLCPAPPVRADEDNGPQEKVRPSVPARADAAKAFAAHQRKLQEQRSEMQDGRPAGLNVKTNRPTWAAVDEEDAGETDPKSGAANTPTKAAFSSPLFLGNSKTDQNVAKFLNLFTKKPESPRVGGTSGGSGARGGGPGSPRRGSVFGDKMKIFFEDTAKKARITSNNMRSEAQATVIRMRDSMAKHKSKFVTFEKGQVIGIVFEDTVGFACPSVILILKCDMGISVLRFAVVTAIE
eukprot:INCI16218.1.p1 GENE.INCI16218.1~~INCI16218.1.p1  ORF type:complete len:852 (-),score=169.02 INCI16218.1:334-2889(-)